MYRRRKANAVLQRGGEEAMVSGACEEQRQEVKSIYKGMPDILADGLESYKSLKKGTKWYLERDLRA